MSSPSAKTLKQLFGLCRNRCAFPKCTVSIVMDENNTVVGEVCHIKGLKSGAARHDPNQTDEERNAFENLILMCAIHHKVIDEDVDSYTVERLQAIKREHETSEENRAWTEAERRDFEELLDRRIRLIIEHERRQDEENADPQEGSGTMALARKMADERRVMQVRASLVSSIEGLEKVIMSINSVFASLDQHFAEEEEAFRTLDIELHRHEKHRVVATGEFGSQVVVEGLDSSNHYRIPDSLRLELMVFGKRPLRQPGAQGLFYTNALAGTTLRPDFNEKLQVVWKDERKNVYTEEALVEKVFTDLLQTIEKEKKLAETLPEGTYRRGGQYVDIWGNPVSENDNSEDWH